MPYIIIAQFPETHSKYIGDFATETSVRLVVRTRMVRQFTIIKHELEVCLLAEEKAVRRASEMEHSNFIALVNMVVVLDSDLASRHLGHPNCHEAHQPDLVTIGFDVNQDASGELSDVWLGFVGRGRIVTSVRRGGIISAVDEDDLFHRA